MGEIYAKSFKFNNYIYFNFNSNPSAVLLFLYSFKNMGDLMEDSIGRLAKIIQRNAKYTGDYRAQAEAVIDEGWIHKEQAVDYVKLCPNENCYKGMIVGKWGAPCHYDCKFCSGKGVVPREEVRGWNISKEKE
jgi:hypothetical protein